MVAAGDESHQFRALQEQRLDGAQREPARPASPAASETTTACRRGAGVWAGAAETLARRCETFSWPPGGELLRNTDLCEHRARQCPRPPS